MKNVYIFTKTLKIYNGKYDTYETDDVEVMPEVYTSIENAKKHIKWFKKKCKKTVDDAIGNPLPSWKYVIEENDSSDSYFYSICVPSSELMCVGRIIERAVAC